MRPECNNLRDFLAAGLLVAEPGSENEKFIQKCLNELDALVKAAEDAFERGYAQGYEDWSNTP